MEAARAPWFCYLAFHAPHAPLHEPPAELHHVVVDAAPKDRIGNAGRDRQLFRAMVEALDTEIGRVLDGLGDALDSTTVIVIGDNGTKASVASAPFDAQHAKGSVYEGGVLVPLIVAGPSVSRRGSVSDALVHAVDVFATVAELAGVALEAALPGVELDSQSLVPYLQDPARASRRDVLYTELFEPNGFGPRTSFARAIRDDRYKLIASSDGDELYDLSVDPYEQTDLLAPADVDPDTSAASARLRKQLEAFAR
jgi:arylsulfatase A-like enzyme